MNNFKKFLIFLFMLTFPTGAFAAGKANLELWKRDPQYYGPCGHCAELLSTYENKNRSDFCEYNLSAQSGYYTLNLSGKKGTAITLFGLENFSTDSGYLVVVKEDDQAIEINDLEAFPSGKWTTVNFKTGGSYSAYYHPHENFKSLVASIKWGKGPQSIAGN